MIDKNSGASLIEIVMAMGLLGLIAMAVSNFATKVNQSQVTESSGQSVERDIADLATGISKKHAFNSNVAVSNCIVDDIGDNKCRKVDITLSDGSTVVSYETKCVNPPSASKIGKRIAQEPSMFNQGLGDCLTSCSSGKIPVIESTLTRSTKYYPPLGTRSKSVALGASVCFFSAGRSLAIEIRSLPYYRLGERKRKPLSETKYLRTEDAGSGISVDND